MNVLQLCKVLIKYCKTTITKPHIQCFYINLKHASIAIEMGALFWLYLALYLARLNKKIFNDRNLLEYKMSDLTLEKFKNSQLKYFLSFILLCSILFLLIDQPDLGQSILLTCSWVATVFISGVSLIYIFIFFLVFLISLSFLFLIFSEIFGYIINLLVIFFDPS